jgi:hypothetical protein
LQERAKRRRRFTIAALVALGLGTMFGVASSSSAPPAGTPVTVGSRVSFREAARRTFVAAPTRGADRGEASRLRRELRALREALADEPGGATHSSRKRFREHLSRARRAGAWAARRQPGQSESVSSKLRSLLERLENLAGDGSADPAAVAAARRELDTALEVESNPRPRTLQLLGLKESGDER